ncbi:MAG: hypothetical protein ACHP79_02560, partial [Terriglobales bacterium]
YMWNKVFMGEYRAPTDDHGHGEHSEHGEHGEAAANPYPPLTWNETTALVIVVIAAIIIGIFPKPFFNYMDKTSGDVAAQLQRYLPAQSAVHSYAPKTPQSYTRPDRLSTVQLVIRRAETIRDCGMCYFIL